jgi:hypothetical protein
MTPNEYDVALEKAYQDLAKRVEQRDILNAEIAGLRETVRVLSSRVRLTDEQKKRLGRLLDMVDCATPTLSDSIRSLLTRAYPKSMTAVQVRDALETSQFNFDDFSNPLSACHAALKRMLADRDVEAEETKDGKTAYKRILAAVPSFSLTDLASVNDTAVETYAKLYDQMFGSKKK